MLLVLLFFLAVRRVVVIFIVVVVAPFSENFGLQLSVLVFILFVVWIHPEDIEAILNVNFVVQTHLMCDLVVLLNQVQFLLDNRVVLEFLLSCLEQDLNHVLCPLVNIGFVEDLAEAVKDGVGNGRGHFFEEEPDMFREFDCDLDGVICRALEQEQQNLCCEHLRDDLMVD